MPTISRAWFPAAAVVYPGRLLRPLDAQNVSNSTAPAHLALTIGNITGNETATNGNVSYGVTLNGTLQSGNGTLKNGLLFGAEPFVGFGNVAWNGTPLYAGKTYNFGAYSGWLVDADANSSSLRQATSAYPSGAIIAIAAYNGTSIAKPDHWIYVSLPSPDHTGNDAAWQNFVNNGFSTSVSDGNLETTVRYLPSGAHPSSRTPAWPVGLSDAFSAWDMDKQYGSFADAWVTTGNTSGNNYTINTKGHFPLLITHRALTATYRYVVYGIGHTGYWNYTTSNGNISANFTWCRWRQRPIPTAPWHFRVTIPKWSMSPCMPWSLLPLQLGPPIFCRWPIF